MRCKRTGLTLAEFVLAASVLAVVALAIAGVSAALTNAYCGSEVYYQSLQTGQNAMMRVCSLIRPAKLVPAVETDRVALWAQDANEDGKINLSEVVVLQYDSQRREVVRSRVEFPDEMDAATRAALDAHLSLASLASVAAALEAVQASPYAGDLVLATDVRAFRLSAAPATPLTRLVKIEFRIGPQDQRFTIRSACALRADATGRVGTVEGHYVLIPDGEDDDDD